MTQKKRKNKKQILYFNVYIAFSCNFICPLFLCMNKKGGDTK